MTEPLSQTSINVLSYLCKEQNYRLRSLDVIGSSLGLSRKEITSAVDELEIRGIVRLTDIGINLTPFGKQFASSFLSEPEMETSVAPGAGIGDLRNSLVGLVLRVEDMENSISNIINNGIRSDITEITEAISALSVKFEILDGRITDIEVFLKGEANKRFYLKLLLAGFVAFSVIMLIFGVFISNGWFVFY